MLLFIRLFHELYRTDYFLRIDVRITAKQQLNIRQLIFDLVNFSSLVNVSLLDYLYSP